MTIKEIETLTGLTRANIRFYESEGLLHPARGENGYRDYSKEDADLLQKIKLLRALHVSLDEIRALQKGERALSSIMQEKIRELEEEKQELARAESICRIIQSDHVGFDDLPSERYLAKFDEAPNLESDALPRVRGPIRRYFARAIDLALYSLPIDLILMLGFRINTGNFGIIGATLLGFLYFGIMLVTEPLLLSRWGTTVGKWLLGMTLTSADGSKLTYADAFERTGLVLWHGMGFGLPVWDLICQVRCYRACNEGKTLPWEDDSVLHLKDKKRHRVISAGVVYALLITVTALCQFYIALPIHRGDITAEQFHENYNQLAEYHDILTYKQNEEGQWVSENGNETTIVSDYVDISCVEQDGALKSVTLQGDYLIFYEGELYLCLNAFVLTGQPQYVFNDELLYACDAITAEVFGEGQLNLENFLVTYCQSEEGFTVTIEKQ
ncbi:MAG: MerR family transcriptional regulator [Clostridia bacterium]|nr:MerR family transcriptional regulator [Clostridia bacterium]